MWHITWRRTRRLSFDSVKSFCTGSSCASGAEKRGDPRQGPRAAGGAGAPSSRISPPPRFLRVMAAPARSATPIDGRARRRCGRRRLDEGSPGSRRFGRSSREDRCPPLSAACRLRPARLASVTRLLRGTFASGPVLVAAQTRVAGGGTRRTDRFAHLFRAEATSSPASDRQGSRSRTRWAPRTFAQTARASNSPGHKQAVRGSSPLASSLHVYDFG